MTTLRRKLKTAWRLPRQEKLWLAFLLPYSAMVRVMIWGLPFRRFAWVLGRASANHEALFSTPTEQQLLARRIGAVCRLVARYAPWECKCLAQAIMARTLLGFYKTPYVIHLGVLKENGSDSGLKAHAWLRVDGAIITGGADSESYVKASTYLPRFLSSE
ncbi:lasso peptide biosynthesis B2 protein [Hahella sp. CR1]|uniref:lasso peptide biosynthesis B2 protein n=1 Tax=Hahella sp. CR1 TaxID=2992807 RepID=UPI00244315CF|nr:lasso peptide biosynthesis B2 protein [Hahella sp. CR1]MDG9669962.1 lasso peptide biosynthesis B2 protein [Hahella sp. CR1]